MSLRSFEASSAARRLSYFLRVKHASQVLWQDTRSAARRLSHFLRPQDAS